MKNRWFVVLSRQQKTFCERFCRDMSPQCRVNVQIALKFSIFFLNFPRFSKIFNDVYNSPEKFRNYVAKPTLKQHCSNKREPKTEKKTLSDKTNQ